ncbi:MAG TPA: very short patch repair endonuclease [Thermoanaerobaculia bacterium]|jgi:DNA mismatch endonuclease (patch repair protein)|nr:very short patch repair endonuclease [Thermoanaerobaculia bacterium]
MAESFRPHPLHRAASVSYKGRKPASPQASATGRANSRKSNTQCELALRQALWAAGYRYRKNVADLPGRPDVVFLRARVAVFVDGDFWHGRDWENRRQKLQAGSNPNYWIAKIQRNMERDREIASRLESMGWTVLRFWESEVRSSSMEVVLKIGAALTLALDKDRDLP